MDKPLISFCLPTYNRLAWIGEAVMSLLSQTEKDIEIVIVDDGSTDGTWEFLSEWLKDNPKVTLVRNERNMGAGPSRHKACEIAKADIIGVCDSDDINVIERAEKTLEWFKDNPDSELVTFPYVSIGYNNEYLESYDGSKFDHEEYEKTEKITYYCNPSTAFKKNAYFETGGYLKENKSETDDAQFVRNWVKSGKKIDFSPGNPVVGHRVLPDSMMVQFRGFKPEWAEKQ